MTSAIVNRIGKKVQVAVASAVIAGGLLAATPMLAGAHEGSCPDFDGDGMVRSSDILFVVTHYLQPNAAGGTYGIGDILETITHYGQICTAS